MQDLNLHFYRTTYHLDVLHNLEFLDDQLRNFNFKEYQYKWIVIGMHNLLQSGFVLCVKERGSNFNISKKQHVKKWFKKYDNEEELFLMDLAHFEELGKKSIQTILQPGIEEYKKSLEVIQYFNNNRNRMIHFNIDSMSFAIYDILYFTNKASYLLEKLFERNKCKVNAYDDEYSKYMKNLNPIIKNSNKIFNDYKSKLKELK